MMQPNVFDFSNTPVSTQRPYYGYAPLDPLAPPAVTIVTPFYNTNRIFEETVRSVLQQSFQRWEWLIVNDGSTNPESLTILNEYRDCEPRIRVIDHPCNLGLSASRNTGFREARTKYVVLLDSDDLIEPTTIEKWAWFLESYPEYAFVKGFTVGFGAMEYLWQKGFNDPRAFLRENQVDITSMIRKDVHTIVGGFDESNRGGLEDWDFWLHCASQGYWGYTIPEFFDWYRRRQSHQEWANWDESHAELAFRSQLRQRYTQLWDSGFPTIKLHWHMPNAHVPAELPFRNVLRRDKHRLLLVVPWLTVGGADKFNLDLIKQLTSRGWEITIASTMNGDHSWLPYFSQYTPDIFILHNFLRLVDYPRFLRYLIESRQIDAVLVTNSEFGYLLLPYLRAHCPHVTFLDFCHMEEENWKNGGYPRMAVEYQEMLDLNLTSSEHLKQWMVQRGADAARIAVSYTNVDLVEPSAEQSLAIDLQQELSFDGTVPLILFVGRICTQKQPRVLAGTLLQLRNRGLSFRAVVAGDGPELAWLRAFITKHSLNHHVFLLGAVSNHRVRELMDAADLFFLPSEWEGIALSIYEALACGVPVVGANVGGQQELVTPECGVLIQRTDEETEIQQYTDVLADLLHDTKRRKRMGSAGRERVRAFFRLEQMGERIEALLMDARELSQTQPRPTPSLGVARICAAETVEYIRLFQLSEQLWSERHGIIPVSRESAPISWRARVYIALYRWHEPYYRWYKRKGWTWLTPIREIVKYVLFQGVKA